MKIGEVLAREVMGKDFIEPERVSVPERRKTAKITHGFDPRKMVSTVSYTCSACNKHCGRDDKECPYCHAEFVDHIWNPPADIKEAMDKQRPQAVIVVGVGKSKVELCPGCGEEVYAEYCESCGQRLDWNYVK